MNIDKAIEIKSNYVDHLPLGVNEDWINADKLSIEGLKRLQELRRMKYVTDFSSLPGESEV